MRRDERWSKRCAKTVLITMFDPTVVIMNAPNEPRESPTSRVPNSDKNGETNETPNPSSRLPINTTRRSRCCQRVRHVVTT